MGAIYNICFECELSGRNHIIAPNNSLFIPLYGNYHQCSRALCQSAEQRPEGPPGPAERGPVLELTSLPWAFSLLPSLYGPGSAGSLFCLAPGSASVFHEILGQENLPILIWQAQGHYHFRLGSKQREHWVQSPPFRNGDTGAQRSEGTWPHHLGNLWQNWDIDPDHFPFPSQGFQH